MNLLKIKIRVSSLVLIAAMFMTACAVTPEQGIGGSNTDEQDTASALKTGTLEKTANNPTNSEPAKDYAALVPNTYKNPKNLIQLKPDQLIEILGPPSFRRTDTPAEIWQYRYGGCVLNLILYENGKSRSLSVAHYSIHSMSKNSVVESTCLLDLLIDRQKKLDGAVG